MSSATGVSTMTHALDFTQKMSFANGSMNKNFSEVSKNDEMIDKV